MYNIVFVLKSSVLKSITDMIIVDSKLFNLRYEPI